MPKLRCQSYRAKLTGAKVTVPKLPCLSYRCQSYRAKVTGTTVTEPKPPTNITFAGATSSNEPHPLTQGYVNDIVRDLKLSKKQAEPLGSRVKGWKLLRLDSEVYYCGHAEEFKDLFSLADGVVFCSDACYIMEVLGHE